MPVFILSVMDSAQYLLAYIPKEHKQFHLQQRVKTDMIQKRMHRVFCSHTACLGLQLKRVIACQELRTGSTIQLSLLHCSLSPSTSLPPSGKVNEMFHYWVPEI